MPTLHQNSLEVPIDATEQDLLNERCDDSERDTDVTVRRKHVIFMAGLPLLLHAMSVAGTAIFFFAYLSGRNFGIHRRFREDDALASIPPGESATMFSPTSYSGIWFLLQSDATAIHTILLLITRFLLTTWYMDTTWKCIFILLEKTGLSISQIQDLIGYKLLLRPRSSTGLLHKAVDFIPLRSLVSLVLILPFLSLFSSPFLTGSITWVASNDLFYTETSVDTNGTVAFSAAEKWDEYNDSSAARDIVIRRAVKHYNMLYSSTDERAKCVLSDLPIYPSTYSSTIRPSVVGAQIPYFSMSVTGLLDDQTSAHLRQALDPFSGWFNITPLADSSGFLSSPGTGLLLPGEKWHPTPFSGSQTPPRYMKPQTEGTSWLFPAAVLRTVTDTYDADISEFSDYTAHRNGVYLYYGLSMVNITAGLAICPACRVESDQILTTEDGLTPAWVDGLGYHQSPADIQPDPLVAQVVWLMPQVIDAIVPFGADAYFPVDSFTLFRRAYFASWSALTTFTSNKSRTMKLYEAVPSTKAIINYPMVFIWIMLQSFVWIGGGIFMIIERRCKRPLTLDTAIGLIFLPQSEEVQRRAQESGLSEVIEVDVEEHSKNMGLLKLEYDVEKGSSRLVRYDPDCEEENSKNSA